MKIKGKGGLFLSLIAGAIAFSSDSGMASVSGAPVMITEVHVMTQAGGQVIFNVSGVRSNMPACATAGNRWAFSDSNAGGQGTLSALLTAYAAGKLVTIYGTGVCDVWGDTESVDYIVI